MATDGTNRIDELKRAAARAAVAYVPDDSVVGVGTGSTVNHFIDELARIKGRIEGAVSSSKASTERLKGLGIPRVRPQRRRRAVGIRRWGR